MDRFLNILTYAIGLLFVFNGLMWLISPADIASTLGMPLLTGHGLSTQIGDLASFFLVVGIFSLLGAYTKKNLLVICTCSFSRFCSSFKNNCIPCSWCCSLNR